jgi:acyl-CoA thioesterase FadM
MDSNKPGYKFMLDMQAPAADEGTYVSGMQQVALMYDAALDYLAQVTGCSDRYGMADLPVRPLLRGVTAEFRGQLLEAESIRVGVRTQSCSGRGFTLEHVVTADGDRLVASGTTSITMFDPAAGRSANVPDTLLAAIEAADGRTVPAAEQS